VTVAEWLDTWLKAITEEVAPKTHERYAEIVNHFLVPGLGNLQLGKLAPAHLQMAYSKWVTSGRRDGKLGGLSPRTRRHIHRILSSALARNPCEAFKKRLPKVERREMAALTADQSQHLLAAISHMRIYWPVLIALTTGMRRGEILALQWRNLDLDSGMVRVVESLEQTKIGLRMKAPKSEKTRAIALPSFAVKELGHLKRRQAEELYPSEFAKMETRWSVRASMDNRCSHEALPTNSRT
jgi:integrase